MQSKSLEELLLLSYFCASFCCEGCRGERFGQSSHEWLVDADWTEKATLGSSPIIRTSQRLGQGRGAFDAATEIQTSSDSLPLQFNSYRTHLPSHLASPTPLPPRRFKITSSLAYQQHQRF